MSTFPLQIKNGHLFLELDGNLWLFDTGAPTSFGGAENLAIEGETFNLDTSYMGLSAESLSSFVGVNCLGLIGADVIGRFDYLIDGIEGRLTVSKDELAHSGKPVTLSNFMDIPILTARVAGAARKFFFDTGAQISYFQDESLTDFPLRGTVTDFFPGIGQFQTSVYDVELAIGKHNFTLRCGALPGLLGMTLTLAGTEGIVGNEVLENRVTGYFPRRKQLCL